jgi:two-component system response regulator AtoC
MAQKDHLDYPPVLLVDDDEINLKSLSLYLKSHKWEVLCASSGKEALERLKDSSIKIVITDIKMPDIDGLTLLRKIKELQKDVEVIMMTGHSTEDIAISALKAGAFDYFHKPVDPKTVIVSLLKTKYILELVQKNKRLESLVGLLSAGKKEILMGKSSKPMMEMLGKIAKTTDASVLITGESGSGKEVVARLLHQMSKPEKAPFVAINCGGISETLLERELFGNERGAYTGAEKQMPGIFELAIGGTVLLDEITEMNLAAQSRFLRVIEERSFRRLGGSSEISLVDTRIIGATNKDLERLVHEGKFREDLFFRLDVLSVSVPPLRERKEEILPLAKFFLQFYDPGKSFSFSSEAEQVLFQYNYPGNIRELKNIVQNAAVLTTGDLITPCDLRLHKTFQKPENSEAKTLPESNTCNLIENEIELIRRVLIRFNNNQSSAAKALGITPQALNRRVKRYNLLSSR